jgi:hypothetical protein
MREPPALPWGNFMTTTGYPNRNLQPRKVKPEKLLLDDRLQVFYFEALNYALRHN